MPGGLVLHEIHALAFDGVGDDHHRPLRLRVRGVDGVADLVEVVAVDLEHAPAEGLELLVERLQRHDLLGRAVEAEVVAVDERREVGELVVAGGHGGLPHRALVALAVAEHAVGAVRVLLHPGAQGDADREREAVAQRAGRAVDAGDLQAVQVHAEGRAGLVEVLQQLRVEVALVGEDRPRGRRRRGPC